MKQTKTQEKGKLPMNDLIGLELVDIANGMITKAFIFKEKMEV